MSLRGSLKNFSMVDVLQLLMLKGKQGFLHVEQGNDQIDLFLSDGFIMQAEPKNKYAKDMLGTMLVRAGRMTDIQLAQALTRQKQKPNAALGHILIDLGIVVQDDVLHFTRLKIIEQVSTIMRWTHGTYEFIDSDTINNQYHDIRVSINDMLKIYAQQDTKWHAIKKNIPHKNMTFETIGQLDDKDPLAPIYDLVYPGRNVQQIIDMSGLGEFSTCLALSHLIEVGKIKPISISLESSIYKKVKTVVMTQPSRQSRKEDWLLNIYCVVVPILGCCILYLAAHAGLPVFPKHQKNTVASLFSQGYQQEIKEALGVYKMLYMHYPESLQSLVDAGLITEKKIHGPWQQLYVYHRDGLNYDMREPLY